MQQIISIRFKDYYFIRSKVECHVNLLKITFRKLINLANFEKVCGTKIPLLFYIDRRCSSILSITA